MKEDTFSVRIPEPPTKLTRRSILRFSSGIFDPLGLFSPVTIVLKVQLQQLLAKHSSWDEEIEDEYRGEITSNMKSVYQEHPLTFPRMAFSGPLNKEDVFDLVGFLDASAKAYGCAIYIRRETSEGSEQTLIFAKSRVSPIQKYSIPRLELLGLVLCCKCIQTVKRKLGLSIRSLTVYSDSKCCLSWIHSTKQLDRFVRNRVTQINSYGDISFGYIKTDQNPADLPSRGCPASELISNSLWWQGQRRRFQEKL